MKKLSVRNIHANHSGIDFIPEDIQRIDSDTWNNRCHVEAGFSIGHDTKNIYIRFTVLEENTRAVHKKFNDPVYEDSCVEFFVSFDKENYYNLEFNCIGTILGEYGKTRDSRVKLPEGLLKKIKATPSLGTTKINIVDRETEWTLDIVIPASVFKYSHPVSIFHGKAYGNFYKCGDRQVVPHYLSWNPVLTGQPDFHRPEYFGELDFE